MYFKPKELQNIHYVDVKSETILLSFYGDLQKCRPVKDVKDSYLHVKCPFPLTNFLPVFTVELRLLFVILTFVISNQ